MGVLGSMMSADPIEPNPPKQPKDKQRPPTPAEWAAELVAEAPKPSEEQIRELCRVYGIPYEPPPDD